MRRPLHWLWLPFAAGAFWLAARLNGPLSRERARHLPPETAPLEQAPPLVTFSTIALGGFRGILADLLWLRAARLQDEGRYFELVQLANWITRLEPRFTEAWAYHAWNLAYNISVLFDAPEDRWRWVQHGIRLLRDEGLVINPGHPRLCRELAWLFFHKLAANLDQAHLYYKKAWAAEMTEVLGGPSPDHLSPEQRRRLQEEYRLDPDLMKEADARYGPFDWRLPQAHAVYWSWRGLQRAKGFEATAAEGLIQQAQIDAFRNGRLFQDPENDVFLPSPNLDLLPRTLGFMDELSAAQPDDASLQAAYRASRREIIMLLYAYRREAEARRLFDDLKARFPAETPEADMEEVVFLAYTAELEDLSEWRIAALVESAAYQAYFWRALGDDERAAGYDQLARLCWQRYMAPRTDAQWRERTGLPPLAVIQRRALERVREELPGAGARARLDGPATP